MHGTYMFLFTPPGTDSILETAQNALWPYIDEFCDENNWHEIMAVVSADGRIVVSPDWQDRINDSFPPQNMRSMAGLRKWAFEALLGNFKITYPASISTEEMQSIFESKAPAIVGSMYTSEERGEYSYERKQLTHAYECYCDCSVKPFCRGWATPYDYWFYDMRFDRWDGGYEIIRDNDAVLLVDIHT